MKRMPCAACVVMIALALLLPATLLASRPPPRQVSPQGSCSANLVFLPAVRKDPAPTPTATPTPRPAGTFAVGLVTDTGSIHDGTFNELAYNGMIRAANEFGLYPAYIETSHPRDFARNIAQFTTAGYDMIVTVGFLMGVDTANAARAYPDSKFAIVDYTYPDCWPGAVVGWDCGSDVVLPNVLGLTFDRYQVGFLAGCLAGLMTRSDTVGVVAGMEIPPVIDFRTGYEHGAMYANGNVRVLGVYIDSFTDPERGKQAALSQIAQGADVIFGAAGPTGSGAVLAAAQTGVWAIGVDYDEYLTTFGRGTVPGANKLLSSAVERIDVAVYTAIRNTVLGPWTGGTLLFDATNDGVGLAPFHEAESAIPQAVKDRLQQILQDMKDGKLPGGPES